MVSKKRKKLKETHPICPRCGSDETRLTRRFGIPTIDGEQWCTKCSHRWVPSREGVDDKGGSERDFALNCLRCRKLTRRYSPEQKAHLCYECDIVRDGCC